MVLKELCQEDIAVLGQFFCAEDISLCLYPYIKCTCRVLKKLSIQFHQGGLTLTFCVVISAGVALTL